MLERVMVTVVVTGQRVGYPESTLALSSAGLGCETWEPCLFWMLEKACVDLLNILCSRWQGYLWGIPKPYGWTPCVTKYQEPTDKGQMSI